MRIALTGAFGYVGAVLVEHLLRAGHSVSAFSLAPPADDLPSQVAGIPACLGDITKPDDLRCAFDGHEVVIHAAAMGAGPAAADPAGALRVNGYGTRCVLDEASRAGVRRFVYLSTYHVYGRDSGPVSEETPARPVTDYGISKAAGEGAVFRSARRGDIEAVIARFSNGFGAPAALSADCWSLAFPSFCRSAAQDGVVQLSSAGQQQRDFLTLSDMAAAIELLLDAPGASSGDTDVIYNVGGGRSLSMREAAAIVAQEYCELTGERIEVGLPGDALSAPREAAVEYCFDRIAALGYRPKGDLAAEARATLSLLGVGRTPR